MIDRKQVRSLRRELGQGLVVSTVGRSWARGGVGTAGLLGLVAIVAGCALLGQSSRIMTPYREGSATIVELSGAPEGPPPAGPLALQDGSGHYGPVLGVNMTFGVEGGWQVVLNALDTDTGGDVFVIAPGGWSASGREGDTCEVDRSSNPRAGVAGRAVCRDMVVRTGDPTGTPVGLTVDFEAVP